MKLRVCAPGEIGTPRLSPDEPLPLSTDHSGHCSHASKRLLLGLRRIVCRSCGAQLDPIEVIRGISREWDRYAWMLGQRAGLLREIEALKIEVRNLKAQKRRAGT
jgi:hypothetical protein